MAYSMAEAKNKRSLLLQQRASRALRSNSPFSSTGSCHGTVKSDHSSNISINLDDDFGYRDVFTTVEEPSLPSLKGEYNNDNIRSTARKHGRWEPRRLDESDIDSSAIANAFPGFACVGEAVLEEERRALAANNIPIEQARGHKNAPNMASTRQCMPHLAPLRTFSGRRVLTPRINLTAEILSKAHAMNKRTITPRPSNRITRQYSSNNQSISSFEIECNDGFKVNPVRNRALHPTICDEIDDSYVSPKQANKNVQTARFNAVYDKSNQYTGSPMPRNTRHADKRYPVMLEKKDSYCRDEIDKNLYEARCEGTDNSIFDTPSKISKTLTSQLDHTAENTAGTGNPTQTTTSFFLPLHKNVQSKKTIKQGVPIFTAQGVVKTTRLPHEYVDGIDLPNEEDQIYDMIDEDKANDVIVNQDHNIVLPTKRNTHNLVKKRSDSGLGSSGSEVQGSSGGLSPTDQPCVKGDDKGDLYNEIQRLYFLNDDLEADKSMLVANNKSLEEDNKALEEHNEEISTSNRKLLAENWARSQENNSLLCKIQELSKEKNTKAQECKDLINRVQLLSIENNTKAQENKELFGKVQLLSTEKRHLERDLATVRHRFQEENAMLSRYREELDLSKDERKREEASRTSNDQRCGRQIELLREEISELKTKLARSENSSQNLKSKSEKIMELTTELKSTKTKTTSKRSSSRKTKEVQKKSSSNSLYHGENTGYQSSASNFSLPHNGHHSASEFDLSIESNSEDSSSIHSTNSQQIDTNSCITKASNFSDILGHGYMRSLNIRQKLIEDAIKRERAECETDFEETINSAKLESTIHSINISTPVDFNTADLSDVASRKQLSQSKLHRRSKSLTENLTTTPKTPFRRNSASAAMNNIFSNVANSENQVKVNTEDIDGPHSNVAAVHAMHKLPNHDSKNCSICLRVARGSEKRNIKSTVRVERPIPVSDRMPISEPYEEEPTLRPSISPGRALAKVIKAISDEIEHLSMKYTETQKAYMNHDPTLGRNSRKLLSDSLKTLLGKIETKKDQIYELFNVLEGQKAAHQEMTVDFLDVTLTNLGIDFDT